MKKLITFLLFLTPAFLLAQKGTIRGSVIDDQTGEPLFMANVIIGGTTTGTTTDFDGKFELRVDPGTYTVQVNFVGLTPTEVTEVEVKAGEVTLLKELRLVPKSEILKTFTVTATATRNSEAAIMTMKRKSVKMIDGISSTRMALTGDGTAIEAAQRVTGVSIEGGKYIYVRGLGDRYTKVTLNDIRIPGLDPDRNSLQMDLFPTNLIANIVVAKNFTADLPADFTGGLVNIETKAFPDEKIMEVSLGVSFNPDMHFNNNFLTYDGGNTDFLGFDDGTRALPADAVNPDRFPRIIQDPAELKEMTSQFDPQLGTQTTTSLLDYSLGFTTGNQKKIREDDVESPTIGYIFSLNYKQSQTHYDNITYAEYQRSQNASENELVYADIQNGMQSAQNNLVGLLGGVAFKTKKDQLKFTAMHIQNGVKRAAVLSLDQNTNAVGKSGYIGESDNLEYEQRSITNLLLNGTHTFNPDLELDWKISPTFSIANDPDIRKTAFTFAIDTSFQAGNAGVPLRLWRDLNETAFDNQVDLTKKYEFLGADAKFQTGVAFLYKFREYAINQYSLRYQGSQNWENNDPDEVLLPENLYPLIPGDPFSDGTYMRNENNDPNSNAYEANALNAAGYVSNELQLTEGLRTIVGLRAEYFNQRHTGRDIAGSSGNIGGNVLNNETVLESFDLFPTVNLIQGFKNDFNLRFAYARTVARPSFKELSFAQIVDPLTGRTFNGGLFEYPPDWDGNLTSTYIHNIDFRFEKFMERGQLYSISLFYKRFNDPIELVRNPLINTSFDYQPRNVGDGELLGIELEIRKTFEFITEALKNYSFSGNVTFVESRIQMATNEFNARQENARVGESIDNTRQMAGQAPYVINAGIEYGNLENGINAGLFYNVKGPTLLIVGTGFVPDIYQIPFHSLNFGISKVFGEEKNLKVDFQASNLLGDLREEFFVSYEAEDQIFTQFNPGRAFSLSFGYNF